MLVFIRLAKLAIIMCGVILLSCNIRTTTDCEYNIQIMTKALFNCLYYNNYIIVGFYHAMYNL